MIAKGTIRRIFTATTIDRIRVRYWDGTEEEFGRDGRLVGTLHIRTSSVMAAMARDPELGFAEGYMHGLIDFQGPMHDIVLFAIQNHMMTPSRLPGPLDWFARGLSQATSILEQRADIAHHYDLGNEFYRLFLDTSMTYSCAYYKKKSDSLEAAQQQKTEHVLRKLNLRKGERLLDIGSGWGELILRAAQEYGVRAHGITMSREQVRETEQRIQAERMSQLVSVSLMDYRQQAAHGQQYDKIVSVGMFEHVGRPNLGRFFDSITAMLKPGGLFLLHFITQLTEGRGGRFTTKYIFPGGYIPSVRETITLLPDRNLRLLDAENLRVHYALTLDEWAKRFESHLVEARAIAHAAVAQDPRWGGGVGVEPFLRMWRLYLQGAAANFRSGAIELHQFLLSHGINNQLPLTREAWYDTSNRSTHGHTPG